MTDGERLVWAASYALALERVGDSVAATRAAARAIERLREAAIRRSSDGRLVISEIDERDYLDEIVSAP
jgi:hypothetical protein